MESYDPLQMSNQSYITEQHELQGYYLNQAKQRHNNDTFSHEANENDNTQAEYQPILQIGEVIDIYKNSIVVRFDMQGDAEDREIELSEISGLPNSLKIGNMIAAATVITLHDPDALLSNEQISEKFRLIQDSAFERAKKERDAHPLHSMSVKNQQISDD
jgi:hypothetical protein